MKKIDVFPEKIVAKVGEQYNKSFHSKVFTLFASSESEIFRFSQVVPVNYDFCFCFIKNEQAQWFLNQESITRARNWVVKEAEKNTEHVMKLYRDWQKDWSEYISCSERLLDRDLCKLTDRELLAEFKKFHELYVGAGAAAYLADSFMSTGETDWLEEMFKKALANMKIEGDKLEILRILLSPGFLSFTIEEELDLLGLAVEFVKHYKGKLPMLTVVEKKTPELYELLEKHRQKYYWINNNYYQADIIELENFYQRLQEMVGKNNGKDLTDSYQEKMAENKDYKDKREKILADLPLNQFHRNVLEISDLFTGWKDVRKSGVCIGSCHFELFLGEIGKRVGIPTSDMTFLNFAEAYEALQAGKDYGDQIAARKEQLFYAVTPEGYYFVAGKEADEYYQYLEQEQSQQVSKLKGVAASPGQATGVVRVIFTADDMKNFQEGEILVANQTTPDFVPVMKKAAAIVTEQGGITSHAAVVSRELKKPCIIGTKVATRAFADGDEVEVDADRGVVKKL